MTDKGMKKRTENANTRQDVVDRLMELAFSYTPEWNPDPENADAGTVMAEAYGRLYRENQDKCRAARKNFPVELANLLGVGLKPTLPAQTSVAFQVAEETVEGVYINKDTKLQAQTPTGETVIFQTMWELYATSSRLTDLVFSSREQGRICWMWNEEKGIDRQPAYGLEPEAFDNISEFVMEHPYAFRFFPGQEFKLDFTGGGGAVNGLLSERDGFVWSYETSEGWKNFARQEGSEEGIHLWTEEGSVAHVVEGEARYRIRCRGVRPVTEEVRISKVCIKDKSGYLPPDGVWVGDVQQEVELFWPFGKTLSLYSECCIACDRVMIKKGAFVTVEFDLAFTETMHELSLPEEPELKPVMKKPSATVSCLRDVRAEEVIFEYFNGVGWCRLDGKGIEGGLFAEVEDRHVTFAFICPQDASPMAIHAGEALWLRMRLVRSEGCYLPNTRHFIPAVRGLTLSYDSTLELSGQTRLQRRYEFSVTDLTTAFSRGESIALFSPVSLPGDHLLLGFDRDFKGGPISLEFDLETSASPGENRRLSAAYSTPYRQKLFSNLNIMDLTAGLTHPGKMVFSPPQGFCEREIYARKRYWVSLSLAEADGEPCREKVDMSQILLNSVDVVNLETLPVKHFFWDRETADSRFYLGPGSIVHAAVAVNEVMALSQSQMKTMLEEAPESVEYTADRLGNITEFFVQWHERESFFHSQRGDRHFVIDRVNNVLVFSQGDRGRPLPKQRDTEIRAVVTVSSGEEGNVPGNAINQAYESIPYIRSVINSRAAWGGCQMEHLERALQRTSQMLLRKNRIITVHDLEEEVKLSFNNILRVKYFSGQTAGKADGPPVLVVLMRDCHQTELSFWHIRDSIRELIRSRGQFLLKGQEPEILPPTMIRIDCEMEVDLEDGQTRGMAYQRILGAVESFLNPVRGNFDGGGWEIGILPHPEQLSLYLRSLDRSWHTGPVQMIGNLETQGRVRQVDIPLKTALPTAIGINGRHHIKWK